MFVNTPLGKSSQQELAIIVIAEAEDAASKPWGRELALAMDKIRGAYPPTHQHDNTSLTAIMAELAKPDAV